jgi:glucose-6-phosphate 1-dehydrogenase
MKTNMKQPGMGSVPAQFDLDLSYNKRFPSFKPPDAYTRLLLDVLKGQQSVRE